MLSTDAQQSRGAIDLLESILGRTQGDDAQLRTLQEFISGVLELPMDVHVVGEPLSLLAVRYEGNPRQGLRALCVRPNGTQYWVAFADVRLPPESQARQCTAIYLHWLGLEAGTSGLGAETVVRQRKASDEDIDLSGPVDLIVLAVRQRVARCRLVGSDRRITLRAGDLHGLVPGHVITVQPKKFWRHAGHPYLSGKVQDVRIDVAALGLQRLALESFGEWQPSEEFWGDAGVPDWAEAIVAAGPRPMFEMQHVLPRSDPDDFDFDPISAAVDFRNSGDRASARDVLLGVLDRDLRALDVHAHLGSFSFHASPELALGHYELGVRIGEHALGEGFDGVLSWGLSDNRPFLRCLHGYGLCLWRSERWPQAACVFERMLRLNPSDNQGVRMLLAPVRAGALWEPDEN